MDCYYSPFVTKNSPSGADFCSNSKEYFYIWESLDFYGHSGQNQDINNRMRDDRMCRGTIQGVRETSCSKGRVEKKEGGTPRWLSP